MNNQIQFGKHTIQFEIKYGQRKTLGIKVSPDTSVLVTAPQDISIEKIHEVVRKKAMWILNQKSYFLEMSTIDSEVIIKSGYSVYYLGRRYKLMIDLKDKEEVTYKGNHFLISVRKKERAEKIFNIWLKHRAIAKILEFSKPLMKKFATIYDVPEEISFQEMPTRWGSCTIKNKLIFNPRLIHTPKRCIEYVIMHELCHLIHKHHNKDFFDLLTQMMPDWELRKVKLDEFI